MPEGWPVIARAMGTKARSYIGTAVRMVRPVKTWNEAGGIWKECVMDLDMVLPCLVKYVLSWDVTTANIRQLNQMGMSWRRSFTSSTWFGEQTLHGFLFSLDASFESIIIAFSKNLHSFSVTNQLWMIDLFSYVITT